MPTSEEVAASLRAADETLRAIGATAVNTTRLAIARARTGLEGRQLRAAIASARSADQALEVAKCAEGTPWGELAADLEELWEDITRAACRQAAGGAV